MSSSSYVYGSQMSYLDYLQGKHYLDDLKSNGHYLYMDVSRQNQKLLASNNALVELSLKSGVWDEEKLETFHDEICDCSDALRYGIPETISQGFDRLSYQLSEVSNSIESGFADLGAKFHWCCSHILSKLRHMNDSLKELVKVAKTPTQTAALEHFEIARDAYRKGLYTEALEELNFAINGVPGVTSGYKLEWRFHQLLGVIKLGFMDCDPSLVNLAEAEQAFLAAARYASTDFCDDAAIAYLSAGWAAYCQGKMQEALDHTECAGDLNPILGEIDYQRAKIKMAMGNTDSAFLFLGFAIGSDISLALKAVSDGDFLKHEAELQDFLNSYTKEFYKLKTKNMLDSYEEEYGAYNIKDVTDRIKSLVRGKAILDYPLVLESWRRLKRWIKQYVEQLGNNESEIVNLSKKIKAVKGVHDALDLLLIRNLHGPDKIEKWIAKLREIETLNKDHSLLNGDKCDDLMESLQEDISSYIHDLCDKTDKYYQEEIGKQKEIVTLLEEQVSTKTRAFIERYEAAKK